jgi:hypothetical protein
MHVDARVKQGKKQRQAHEYVEAATSSDYQDILTALQLFDKRRLKHLITTANSLLYPQAAGAYLTRSRTRKQLNNVWSKIACLKKVKTRVIPNKALGDLSVTAIGPCKTIRTLLHLRHID